MPHLTTAQACPTIPNPARKTEAAAHLHRAIRFSPKVLVLNAACVVLKVHIVAVASKRCNLSRTLGFAVDNFDLALEWLYAPIFVVAFPLKYAVRRRFSKRLRASATTISFSFLTGGNWRVISYT